MYLYTCRMGGRHVRHSANIRIIIHGTINKMISQANVMPGPADASIWNDLSFWQTRLRCRTRIPTSIYLSIPQVKPVYVRFIPFSTTQSFYWWLCCSIIIDVPGLHRPNILLATLWCHTYPNPDTYRNLPPSMNASHLVPRYLLQPTLYTYT